MPGTSGNLHICNITAFQGISILTYNLSRDLWKALCISEPFYAKVHADADADAVDDEEEGQDYSTTGTSREI